VRAWVTDRVTAVARSRPSATARYGAVWGTPNGPAAGQVAVFAVKSVRYNGFAAHDAPLAVYGVVTCADAFAPLFQGVLRRHPLLPSQVAGGVPNARLVGVDLRDPAGATLLTAGPRLTPTAYVGDAAPAEGGLVVRAWLPPDVAGRLIVARPSARLPLLLGLLLLTAGLTATAAFQFRREQELLRLRQDFTSSVSHELRTPLTQILLFGETLELGRASGEDARREAVGVIVQEARRLAHLVENVLHLSRAERRLMRVRPAPVPLGPALREIVERFAPLAGAQAVRIRTELDETLIALADGEALHQIVINLLDNAVKYGGSGPVVVRAAAEQGWARISVEDGGEGVAAGDRGRIWEPFVRLHPTGAVPGSGIGLAVVRELVAAHGGACRVEEGPGGGSRFVIDLPTASPLAHRPVRPPAPSEAPWPAS
jgi:signal transduction histidine kinase